MLKNIDNKIYGKIFGPLSWKLRCARIDCILISRIVILKAILLTIILCFKLFTFSNGTFQFKSFLDLNWLVVTPFLVILFSNIRKIPKDLTTVRRVLIIPTSIYIFGFIPKPEVKSFLEMMIWLDILVAVYIGSSEYVSGPDDTHGFIGGISDLQKRRKKKKAWTCSRLFPIL